MPSERDTGASVRTHDLGGTAVREIRLTNAAGARASVLTWGAVLGDLQVPLPGGRLRRVVLGYDDPRGYIENPPYLGTMVGRVCNRIAQGRFALDGCDCALPVNGAGDVHLHGGVKGLTRRNWELVAAGPDTALLRIVSPDGDEGYPGEVTVTCRYTLTDDNTLRIDVEGTTDAPTLLNMTNHSYFTLAEGAVAADHWLEVAAEFYTPAHPNQIPTGEVLRVDDTRYDFRTLRRIGADYEVNFAVHGPRGAVHPVARLVAPERDLEMVVASDQPGLLFYTGAGLPEAAGPDGQRHGPSKGLCLEAAGFCNAINTRHFPSPVLRPGEIYRNSCEYRFRAL